MFLKIDLFLEQEELVNVNYCENKKIINETDLIFNLLQF